MFFPLLCLSIPGVVSISSPVVGRNARVDCAPKPGEGKPECLARGCQWDENFDPMHSSIPLCYFPPRTGYGIAKRQNATKIVLKRLSQGAKNPYGEDLDELEFTVRRIGPATLHLAIGTKERYRPPIPLNEGGNAEHGGEVDDGLSVRIFPQNTSAPADQFFYFVVRRESDGTSIWDTSIGGLLFADQFIQIATYLPGERIYGFGENAHQQLKHDFSKYSTWGMFTRDQEPDPYSPNSRNLYGVHPFYVGIEPSGKAHGVLLLNSNAQEVTTGPAPHLVYRTIGGQLDLFFFAGPTPELVVRQYQQLIGLPQLPPYWALGYQFCRFGYRDLADLKATVARIRGAGIPLDVVYADIDYMHRYQDFTVDDQKWSGLGAYVEELHRLGLKFVPILDPAVEVDYAVFQRARDANATFVEWDREDQVPREVQSLYPMANDTKIMLGIVWPDRHVAFPDFLDPQTNTNDWWKEELRRFREEVNFDGIWIDMNEPANFATNSGQPKKGLRTLACPLSGPESHFDAPPYQTVAAYQYGDKSALSEKTLCLLGKTRRGAQRLYNTHSLFGWAQTVATRRALDELIGKRSQLLSRSTFVGSGRYATHWSGDNYARWTDLAASSLAVMEFNMFGIPHMGTDVCGFNLPTNEELCLRWQQLGAFHPFFRNHNSDDNPPHDPAQWESVANASRVANLFRYQHLPYLYSLHFRVSMLGGTVVRPLFFEFPGDFGAYTLSHQFMWGPSVMVVPVLDAGVDAVRAYFPFNSSWYSISNAHQYASRVSSEGGYRTVSAPRDTPLPTFQRAGTIVPRQRPAQTVAVTRRNELQLVVALDPVSLSAVGELFWDDGESLIASFDSHPYYQFQFEMRVAEKGAKNRLVVKRTHFPSKSVDIPSLDSLEVLGLPLAPNGSSLALNGRPLGAEAKCKCEYNANKELANFQCKGMIPLGDKGPDIWTLEWTDAELDNGQIQAF